MPWLEAILACAGVLITDQVSKHLVLARPHYAAATAPRSFLAIRCIINRRGALPPAWRSRHIAAFALCAASAVLVLAQGPLTHNTLGSVGIGLALGGIAGNFVDLMRRGGFVDFIAIGSLSVFNIADVAIVGGLALALWSLA